jgi:hypothetical protein
LPSADKAGTATSIFPLYAVDEQHVVQGQRTMHDTGPAHTGATVALAPKMKSVHFDFLSG